MAFFTKPRIICWLLLSCIALVVFLSYMSSPKTRRVLLYFQQSNGSIGTEERYLPYTSAQDFAVLLAKELLLGPFDHSLLPFSDPDVQAHRCFVRNGSLYIDVSAKILNPKVKTPDFHTVYTLFKKNIMSNCKDIHTIYMYIDGTPAYPAVPVAHSL